MSGMAEVLVAHQRVRGGCLCGWDTLGKSHPEHVAAMLTDAGFGDVREAKAEALEDAADSIAAGGSISRWLRARARSLRGEGA